MEELKILELFGGIGAIRKAFQRQNIPHKVVDYVEIDKYAVASYNAMFNENFEPQDITKWDKDIDVDFIMHGSPCQDFSVAGKQAGGDLGSGTRSSLMYETIRIVGKLRPKYVMWENVKNLLSKKHKHNFDAYIETMDILGYNSYYQVLNGKDYGIPQNRERVYTISIRKDIDKGNFVFPEKEELKLRLKDMLEPKVDEKYYLSDDKVSKIECSNFMQEKKRIQEKEYSDTILARDWKDPKCVRVGGIFDNEKSKHQAGSVYDKEGIAPTLDVMQGGWRQPSIVEEKLPGAYGRDFGSKGKIQDTENICDTLQAAMGNGGGNVPIIKTIGNYMPSGHDASRIVDSNGLAPTVKENHGTVTAVIEPKIITHNIVQKVLVRKYPVDKEKLKQVLRDAKIENDISNEMLETTFDIPITTIAHWFRKDDSFAIPNPEIWLELKRILHIETDEFDESIMTFEEKESIYDKSNRVYDEQGIAPTLTQQEEKIVEYERTPLKFLNRNQKNIEGDYAFCVDSSNTGGIKETIENEIRIRKLTPKECWKLMGFDDEDFDKAQKVNSNTQLYKQAGNSIIVNVLEKILENLITE